MKRLRALGAVVSCLLLIGIAVGLGTADSHHTNVKYWLWKHHLVSYEATLALKYFNVDTAFQHSLYGKTKSQVLDWFPVLNPADPSEPYNPYFGDVVRRPGFVWIDHSPWGIVFENDLVIDIVEPKG